MGNELSAAATVTDYAPMLPVPGRERVISIDALRGFVMFTMIFVNDLAGAGKIAPDWMVHFSDRHKGGSGMTFVDLVFPAFLFIVGMSIPITLAGRLAKGEPGWKLFLHVVVRTVSLLALGILMVNEGGANTKAMGFDHTAWVVSMYLAALLAFCSVGPTSVEKGSTGPRLWRGITVILRLIGLATLIWLAFIFRTKNGGKLISLDPFSVRTSWYGILGLIGWAYLVASIVFLLFRTNRTAILGCIALLLCLFVADRKGAFEGFFLSKFVGIGEDLGSLASITTSGVLLGTLMLEPDGGQLRFKSNFWTGYLGHYLIGNPLTRWSLAWLWGTTRTRFTLLFIGGFAAAAWLLTPQWGISKNSATPAWCLWSCAITAALWLIFYLISDVWHWRFISTPLAIAGQNVLLAYLLSEMQGVVFDKLGWGHWYGALNHPYLSDAIARSAGCAAVILLITAALNRIGFRLKL